MMDSQVGGAGPVRCGVYTRKSTEEGLEQAFNTLQAQREAAEFYIQSQRQGGWLPHTTRAMLSAGGSLMKKHGLVVISEKVGDERRYSIRS